MLAGTGAKRKTCAERRTFAGNQFRFPRVVSHVFMFLAVCFDDFVGLGFRSFQVGFSSHRFHNLHDMSTEFYMEFGRFVFAVLVPGFSKGWKWIVYTAAAVWFQQWAKV